MKKKPVFQYVLEVKVDNVWRFQAGHNDLEYLKIIKARHVSNYKQRIRKTR